MTSDEGDLLYGGSAIRDFLNSLGRRKFSLNHTYKLIVGKRIPTRRSGPKIRTASKREIRPALGLSDPGA
jgi:hypothetical protein